MSNASNRRLLRLPEVKEKVGLSRTAIYKLIAEGQFPRQVCIGPRTVAWSRTTWRPGSSSGSRQRFDNR